MQASLVFARSGERTFIHRQEMPYPFHVTRPFVLDVACLRLSTLYLQSASGGLYRGDRLALTVDARAGAMAHLTTQAATIVHDAAGEDSVQRARLSVGEHALLALTCDPLVLFPGADLTNTTQLTLADGGRAILAEGYATHDPAGRGGAFRRLAARTNVFGPDGRLLCADGGEITGDAVHGSRSPLGPFRAWGTVMILGETAEPIDPGHVERELEAIGCLAGVSALPNGCGASVRLLAPDGGTLARGLDAAVASAMRASLGIVPARRRK